MSEAVRLCLGGSVAGRDVVILCGSGNNGGGGLAAARRLSIWGAGVEVLTLASPDKLSGAPATQLHTLRRAGVPVNQFDGALPDCDAVVDAMVGYNLSGPLRGRAAEAVVSLRSVSAPVIALDVPSGLDVDSGEPAGAAIEAAVTLTLALPKTGLLRMEATRNIGELLLADIGIPLELYQDIGLSLTRSPFEAGPLVRVRDAEGTP